MTGCLSCCLLCGLARLLDLARCLRLRFRFGLLLRCPPLTHSFGGGFALGGAESPALSLLRRRSNNCGSNNTLRPPLQCFYGASKSVSLLDQKGNYMCGIHPTQSSTDYWTDPSAEQ